MKIYSKDVPVRSLPSQEGFASLTKEETSRLVSGVYQLGENSTIAKRNSIPRVMPFLDLNFAARKRVSGDGKGG